MNSCKIITISQIGGASQHGHAPLIEPYEYYLDARSINAEAALNYIRENRNDFNWIEDDLVMSYPCELSDINILDLGLAIAKQTIKKIHSNLPSPLSFSTSNVSEIKSYDGKQIDCFDMTLIQVKITN